MGTTFHLSSRSQPLPRPTSQIITQMLQLQLQHQHHQHHTKSGSTLTTTTSSSKGSSSRLGHAGCCWCFMASGFMINRSGHHAAQGGGTRGALPQCRTARVWLLDPSKKCYSFLMHIDRRVYGMILPMYVRSIVAVSCKVASACPAQCYQGFAFSAAAPSIPVSFGHFRLLCALHGTLVMWATS
jgi:hypothetical protein